MMLKILAIAVTLLVSPVTAIEYSLGSATANSPIDVVCETITVACPETVDEHSDINFQASVARAAGPLLPLRYLWSLRGVPKARIKSGSGTSSIVVSVPRRAAGRLTATVTVIGVKKGCGNTASCWTAIARRQ
jgi:hypothetical protein